MRTLYHHWLDANCRKIRILLAEKKLECQLELEKMWKPRETFTKLNPSGRIPVLVDLNDTVVCENYAICEYLEEAYPERNFLGDNIYSRAETRRLVSWFDNKFNEDVTQKIVFEKIYKRYFNMGHPDATAMRDGQKNFFQHLDYISYLIDRRHWLAGDTYSLADITAAAHLSSLDFLGDVSWDRWPLVKDWYMRIKSRPTFRPLLNDNIPGVTPPVYYKNLDF
ncbi:MAG: glutathione S-transferase family protein [Alphaproteobacteria bacterium]